MIGNYPALLNFQPVISQTQPVHLLLTASSLQSHVHPGWLYFESFIAIVFSICAPPPHPKKTKNKNQKEKKKRHIASFLESLHSAYPAVGLKPLITPFRW